MVDGSLFAGCVSVLGAAGSADPQVAEDGDNILLTVEVFPATLPDSTGIAVEGDLSAIGGSANQAFTDDGGNMFSYLASVSAAPGNYDLAISVEDAQARTAETTIPLSILAEVTIMEIQGEGHVSTFDGEYVTTSGVITAIGFRTLYVQNPNGDGNDATSDGIEVFTFDYNDFSIGECVEMTGAVGENIGGGAATGNLSQTELSNPDITVVDCEATFGSGYSFPTPVVIGLSGRVPPNEITISDDELPVNLQDAADDAANNFDPDEDGIDFYESMEAMLVTVEDAVAVSATRRFGSFDAEFFTLPNRGSAAIIEPDDARTPRGGIFIQADINGTGDLNPERVQIQLESTPLYPGDMDLQVKVGDLVGDITGVVDYSFGNFEINATQVIAVTDGGLSEESTKLKPKNNHVLVASYNVLNLSVGDVFDDEGPDDLAQVAELGTQIVDNLNTPDVVALQEIQDDSGEDDNGVVSADDTLQMLVDAIVSAGGPTYIAFNVEPANNTQGGVPGGNIRNAFLYNPERVDLVGFQPLSAGLLSAAGADPTSFDGTRIPLIGVFEFKGIEFTVVSVHNSSRFGSTPIFGGPQPFVQAGEAEREAQTKALNAYVDYRLAADAEAQIIVTGDFNTFEFTDELAEDVVGPEPVLTNLVPDFAEEGDSYSFIFDGNSQMLDHMFVTNAMLPSAKLDVVHVNVDFPRTFINVTGSDHEPLVATLALKKPKNNPKETTIQLLTVSDWHAQLDPLFVFGEGTFGGAAELSAYFDMERANNPNTLTLTAGDAYGAAPPLSNFFDEEPAVRSMRLMGFDYDTFGNHNFDRGIAHLQSMIDIVGAPSGAEPGEPFQYLSANLENRDANLSGVKDYDVVEIDGVKVGVIGVTNPEAPTLVFPGRFGSIVVTDPVAAANAARDATEDEGATVFVLLAHMGATGGDSDNPTGPLVDLANGVSGFDVIVGDHTDFLVGKVINGALVVENRSRGRTYARIQMTVKTGTNGGVISSSVAFVEPISSDVVPDQVILDMLAPLRAALDVLLSVVIGDSTVDIPRSDECGQSSGRTCESLVGDVVTDAMRTTYGTDFAIMNSGGLRASLTCPTTDIPGDFCNPDDEGKITEGQVLTVLPFGNSVVTLSVTGAELKEHLKRGVSAMPGVSGRFAQVSGLCFTYDIAAAVGSRVMGAVFQAADGTCTGGVVDLTTGTTYTLAKSDFMASGGDGYPVDIGSATTRELLDQVAAAYVASFTLISPAIQGRITCTDSVGPDDCPVALP